MIALIVGAILIMLSIAISLYQLSNPSLEVPEAIAYEYWWMSLPCSATQEFVKRCWFCC